MGRPALGPRLWWDRLRGSWTIRDLFTFIRLGTSDRAAAEQRLAEYLVAGTKCEAYPLYPKLGYIYFVTADQPDFPIKIGWTEKIADVRLRALQTGCPYPLRLITSIPGTYQDEGAMHRKYAADRLCGEWFKRTTELMGEITLMSKEAA